MLDMSERVQEVMLEDAYDHYKKVDKMVKSERENLLALIGRLPNELEKIYEGVNLIAIEDSDKALLKSVSNKLVTDTPVLKGTIANIPEDTKVLVSARDNVEGSLSALTNLVTWIEENTPKKGDEDEEGRSERVKRLLLNLLENVESYKKSLKDLKFIIENTHTITEYLKK